ncbi:MAG: HAMP domain-containing histidine kinase [Patescibacteria group bacterium]|nr:HAMP domain-containing histidine kinase [Patescibacteria group bacterium]MCL5257878.1 HAMP domain-containing histidine kinase [Patescibacteria group bacterium]
MDSIEKFFRIFWIGLISLWLILIGAVLLNDFNYLKLSLILIGLVLSGWALALFLAIKNSEEKEDILDPIFQKIFDRVANGIAIYDKKFKLIYFNNDFEQIVGLDRDVILNQTVGSWMVQDRRYQRLAGIFFPVLAALKFEVIDEKPIEIIDVSLQTDPVCRLRVITIPINVKKQELAAKIVVDLTVESERIKKEAEFLNLTAHHIRTPLSQIKWMLESMKDERLSDEGKELVSQALKVIKNTLILTELILIDVKMEIEGLKLKYENNDMAETISAIFELLNEFVREKNIKVSIEIDDEVKKFYYDRQILILALYPIIENAVVYNKSGGELKISVEKITGRSEVEIKISDTGIGIKADEREHIFEKYYRGSNAKDVRADSFGLGLYLSRELVRSHNGSVSFESEENKGTTMTIIIPFFSEPPVSSGLNDKN